MLKLVGMVKNLIAVGTSEYFLSLACRTWQRLSKKIIDCTWHITEKLLGPLKASRDKRRVKRVRTM